MQLQRYLLAVESRLTEAIDYLGMFNDVVGDDVKAKQLAQKYVTWARRNLKKNDRIVWFLRFAKIDLAAQQKGTDRDAELAKLNRRLKTSIPSYELLPINSLMTSLAHYLSLPIPAITNTAWGTQSPREMLSHFEDAEEEWKESSNQRNLIDYSEGSEPTIVMQFPDGYAWFDLEQSKCSREAAAMGHCGNAAAYSSGETILSLRKLAHTANGRTMWYPVLTFILDEDGNLGEMKGRGNDKPVEKYHPYIVALLKSDRIQGIKGGGYLAQNNFSLRDLPDETREELLAAKPDLADIWDVYNKEGMTERVMRRVMNGIGSHGLSVGSYDRKEKEFEVESWRDYGEFIRSLFFNDLDKILEIALGEADWQQDDDPKRAFVTTLQELPDHLWRERLARRAGISRFDDYSMEQAAHRLIQRNDDYYRRFEDLLGRAGSIRSEAWDRLFAYQQAGFVFACSHAWTNVPSDDLAKFRDFVERDELVTLKVSERDMVAYASTDTDDDDDYGYDLQAMGPRSRSWDAIDSHYQWERWREEGLVEYREDTWLAGLDTSENKLVDSYLNLLRGQSDSVHINDPRQRELQYEGARMRRFMMALRG